MTKTATRPNPSLAGKLSVSHETIYCAIYAMLGGTLRSESVGLLRKSHKTRLPRARGSARAGRLPNMTSIHLRPPEVAARIVPEHWEADLIKGAMCLASCWLAWAVQRPFWHARCSSRGALPRIDLPLYPAPFSASAASGCWPPAPTGLARRGRFLANGLLGAGELLCRSLGLIAWNLEPDFVAKRVEKMKVSIRAKVENPFRVLKRQFGFTKVR